jgi:hypothetical protein
MKLKGGKQNIRNCEVTPHAIWPLAKSLMKRDRTRTPTAIHGPSVLKVFPQDKANAIADCLENHHMTCVRKTMNGEWRLMSKLCLKPWTTVPLKKYDLATYKD